MVFTVVNPNCELSASFVAIFKMANISDTQMIYMYLPCFNLNDLCVNLFIVIIMKKTHLDLEICLNFLWSPFFQYGCQYFQHRNALFTITLEPLGRI